MSEALRKRSTLIETKTKSSSDGHSNGHSSEASHHDFTHLEMQPDKSKLPFLMRHRWVFIILFLFPLSVVFDAVLWLRRRCRQVTPELHDARVVRVQTQIRQWIAAGKKGRLCTDRPGWMAMAMRPNAYKNELNKIKILDLADILHVDTAKGTILVEPFVTVAQLSAKLLPLGYTLPVLPELDDLSVGGLLMGVGVESSSHKYGLFNECCVAYDIVLASGELAHVTPTNEHKELFHALPWSYGTLGMLVAAELRIIPSKKYVHVKYHVCKSQEETVAKFKEFATSPNPPEFVEGLVYGPSAAVVMTGEFASEDDRRASSVSVNSLARWYKPWFYEHVRGFLKQPYNAKKAIGDAIDSEFIPLRDYYHRHTRSIFWEMSEIVPFGNHPLFRYFCGWLLPIRIALLKLTTPQTLAAAYEKLFSFQDMLVPVSALSRSLDCFKDILYLYPLWLCPHRVYKTSPQGFIKPVDPTLKSGEYEMFVDIGAYGMPARPGFNANTDIHKAEEFVAKEKGFQMLYADTYLTEREFESMFNHTLYNAMRKQYGSEGVFPRIYDKVKKVPYG